MHRPSRGASVGTLVIILGTLLAACAPSHDTPEQTSVGGATDSSFAERMVACLNAAGWEVSLEPGSTGFEANVPDEQTNRFQASIEACQTSLAGQSSPVSQWTDAQWRDAYAAQLATAGCLRDEGVQIPEAPSLEVFRESFESDPWLPYAFVNVDQSRYAELLEACPQPE